VERKDGRKGYYSNQKGHRQRSVFHDAMSRPEAQRMGLSRGDLSIHWTATRWLQRRSSRRISDPGT